MLNLNVVIEALEKIKNFKNNTYVFIACGVWFENGMFRYLTPYLLKNLQDDLNHIAQDIINRIMLHKENYLKERVLQYIFSFYYGRPELIKKYFLPKTEINKMYDQKKTQNQTLVPVGEQNEEMEGIQKKKGTQKKQNKKRKKTLVGIQKKKGTQKKQNKKRKKTLVGIQKKTQALVDIQKKTHAPVREQNEEMKSIQNKRRMYKQEETKDINEKQESNKNTQINLQNVFYKLPRTTRYET
jgi:hypothetical protein